MELKKKFSFKGIVFNPGKNTIRYKDKEKKIEPRLMKLFLMLYERKGEVVRKEEILEKIWAEKVVTDDSITQAISQLRKLLAQHSVEIETVRGIGYKLDSSWTFPGNYFDTKTIPLLLTIVFLLYILFGSGFVSWIIETI